LNGQLIKDRNKSYVAYGLLNHCLIAPLSGRK
jgi:hypothetical protein